MDASTESKFVRTAIILAAGKLAPSIAAVFGQGSVALLPLNGRPVVHWTVQYLRDLGIQRLLLAVRPEDTRLHRFAASALQPLIDVECVEIDEDRGPGFSLWRCLERLPDEEPCLVILGDTFFRFPDGFPRDLEQSLVLVEPVDDAARWCFAEADSAGRVTGLIDKPARKPESCDALIGVYCLHQIGPARSALAQAARSGEASIQLRVALAPYIEARQLAVCRAGEWFDCGNLDLLTDTRQRLLQTRNFNRMEVDAFRGTVTKRSTNRQKFVNEINYYRLLPPELAIFFPRVLDHSLDPADTRLTLEYYGYGTLSEMWVFEEFDAAYWHRILLRLAQVVDQFGRFSLELTPSSVFQFYWLKTSERVDQFALQGELQARLVETPEWTIDGVKVLGWPRIKASIQERLKRIAGHAVGQIIHGDLCLPNILFDPLHRVVKLLDPRGSFGESGIFGDARYDVAKLLHSLHGGYDFLIHDMFRVAVQDSTIALEQFFPASRPAILSAFDEIFGERFAIDEVKLLEALLFLSMPALHADAPKRQAAMFAIGLQLFSKLS